MSHVSSDIAFRPAVKDIQSRRGSRKIYEKVEARGSFQTEITADLVAFLGSVDTAYLATASADGQPYAKHRGGPKGFIRVVDEHMIGFADFAGNRQYISTGNLAKNSKPFLFLMDYANRRRIKLWGRARILEGHAALPARLTAPGPNKRSGSGLIPGTPIGGSTSRRNSTPRMFPPPSPGLKNGAQRSQPKTAAFNSRL